MGRRRLTKQQRARIDQRQQQIAQSFSENIQETNHSSNARALQSTEGSRLSGIVIRRYGAYADVVEGTWSNRTHITSLQSKRCDIPARLQGDNATDDVVVGDEVVWENTEKQGQIIAIQPRHTTLIRWLTQGRQTAVTSKSIGAQKVVAANVTRVALVVAAEPKTPLLELDRALVSLESSGFAVTLVCNKCDLMPKEVENCLQQSDTTDFSILTEEESSDSSWWLRLAWYQQHGLELRFVSAVQRKGIDELLQVFAHEIGIFSGPSGVGKSSLINALLQEEIARTGGLTELSQHGAHTTSISSLYVLPEDGFLIDSPGVRSFQFACPSVSELSRSFLPFPKYIDQCRFSNCSHRVEPKCAVKAAVERGDIPAWRMSLYEKLWAEASQISS